MRMHTRARRPRRPPPVQRHLHRRLGQPSSGRNVRHRLTPHGDRALNRALHHIALTLKRCDPQTKDYLTRRTSVPLRGPVAVGHRRGPVVADRQPAVLAGLSGRRPPVSTFPPAPRSSSVLPARRRWCRAPCPPRRAARRS
ncbi:transposase [Actinomadura sp. NAK00032]|nr:transposase [Actinomadura sp. NAK00032]